MDLRVALKVARVRLHELRAFLRSPRRFAVASSGARVLLWGVPFSDWNAPLGAAQTWAGMPGVRDVRRVPAFDWLVQDDDIVIPMKTDHNGRRPPRGRALAPRPETVLLVSDKTAFARFMADRDLGELCPQVYTDADAAPFPCVIKRPDLSASIGVAIAQSRAHLDTLLGARPFRDHPWILQELVSGTTEYTTYGVAVAGAIAWHKTFAFEMAEPAMVRHETNALRRLEIEAVPAAIDQLARVMKALGFEGPFNVDYKIDAAGRAQIFEINPRFGGTLMQPAVAGDLRQALACIVANAK